MTSQWYVIFKDVFNVPAVRTNQGKTHFLLAFWKPLPGHCWIILPDSGLDDPVNIFAVSRLAVQAELSLKLLFSGARVELPPVNQVGLLLPLALRVGRHHLPVCFSGGRRPLTGGRHHLPAVCFSGRRWWPLTGGRLSSRGRRRGQVRGHRRFPVVKVIVVDWLKQLNVT